jgi:hypothetical protein
LDGAIFFLEQFRGFGCNPLNATYISYASGSGARSTESFEVSIGKAYANGEWSGSTTIQLGAGWWGFYNIDFGMAKVTLSTKRVFTNGIAIQDNNPNFFGIDPIAHGTSVCAPIITNATVDIAIDGVVTISIPK